MIGLAKLAPGPDHVGLVEVADPVAGPNQAVVAVTATGICGTDLHIIAGEYPSRPPVVMGHEVTGVVARVGDDQDSTWVGLRVVVETFFATCETCEMCRAGRRNLCRQRESIGSAHNGGFAPFMVCPVANLHEVPARVSDVGAALAEPLACVVQALLLTSAVVAGQRVFVAGPGTMGLLAAQVARAAGAEVEVGGLSSDSKRLRIISSLGFATTIEPPPIEQFDTVIECSGAASAASAAVAALKRGGRYVGIGIFGHDVVFPLDLLLYKELTFTAGFASTAASWSIALRLMASQAVDLDAAISDVLPLAEWRVALERLSAGEGMKILLDPRAETHTQPAGAEHLQAGVSALGPDVAQRGHV